MLLLSELSWVIIWLNEEGRWWFGSRLEFSNKSFGSLFRIGTMPKNKEPQKCELLTNGSPTLYDYQNSNLAVVGAVTFLMLFIRCYLIYQKALQNIL